MGLIVGIGVAIGGRGSGVVGWEEELLWEDGSQMLWEDGSEVIAGLITQVDTPLQWENNVQMLWEDGTELVAGLMRI